jgi:hypothetical protein
MKVYDGASWITATSAGATSLLRFRYVATSGQTTFSGADAASATLTYTVNNIAVHRNGVTLDTSEYTASNGTSIVLTVAAGTGDIIDIIAFKSFTVADALSAVSGGTVNGAVTVTGALTANGNVILGDASTDTLNVGNGGLVKDASGNVGIGTSSPAVKLHVSGQSRVADSSNASNYMSFGVGANASYGNASISTTTAGLSIVAEGAGNMTFLNNGSERARITSDGNLLVAKNSRDYGRFEVQSNETWIQYSTNTKTSAINGIRIGYTAASPNNTGNYFLFCEDNASSRLYVMSNGGLANFSGNNVNLSDRREKTNFAHAGEYLSKICAIPVQTFNYIDQNMEEDGGLTLGVVAQDVQAVAPELVLESNWGSQDETKMRLSIYQTDLQYALMKSIQELKALVDTQAERIAVLEAK